jgi:putative oxidoreductase
MMESLRMRPAKVHAVLAGATETAGGALLAAGLATPVAASALTGVMTTAIRTVHLPTARGTPTVGGSTTPSSSAR